MIQTCSQQDQSFLIFRHLRDWDKDFNIDVDADTDKYLNIDADVDTDKKLE